MRMLIVQYFAEKPAEASSRKSLTDPGQTNILIIRHQGRRINAELGRMIGFSLLLQNELCNLCSMRIEIDGQFGYSITRLRKR